MGRDEVTDESRRQFPLAARQLRVHYLPLACYNGQTPVVNKVPAQLLPVLDEFPRWDPLTTARGAVVDWYGAVGPGSKYSVRFAEDEDGAEARSSACDC